MDAKTIYAQSSDIKSRTYLEYRRDMKRKAIVELELLDWIQNKVKNQFGDNTSIVKKGGGDSFIWFLRKGGITREPDYEVIGKNNFKIELQYGQDINKKSIFDFKISKVAKKERGVKKRIPIKNLVFLYLFKKKPDLYSFINSDWIYNNSKKGVAPAWGNREVYKINGKKMLAQVKEDSKLEKIWALINIKLQILEFQHELIDITKDNLSHLLQKVVDEEKIVKIIPNNLESFFKICFILNNLNKAPMNTNLWLIYLLSYISEQNTTEDLYKVLYCIDFLYSKSKLEKNELSKLISGILKCENLIKKFEQKDGTFKSSFELSPKDEIRYALFSINLLEDLIQDIIHYYKTDKLKPIQKIYQSINYTDKVFENIKIN